MQRLKLIYSKEVVPVLIEQFNYKNLHEVPKIQKIVINRGFGEAHQNSKILESSLRELTQISGQSSQS